MSASSRARSSSILRDVAGGDGEPAAERADAVGMRRGPREPDAIAMRRALGRRLDRRERRPPRCRDLDEPLVAREAGRRLDPEHDADTVLARRRDAIVADAPAAPESSTPQGSSVAWPSASVSNAVSAASTGVRASGRVSPSAVTVAAVTIAARRQVDVGGAGREVGAVAVDGELDGEPRRRAVQRGVDAQRIGRRGSGGDQENERQPHDDWTRAAAAGSRYAGATWTP